MRDRTTQCTPPTYEHHRLGRLFIPRADALHRPLIRERGASVDRLLLLCILVLSVFGTVMIYSAGYAYAAFRYDDPTYFIRRQLLFLAVGLALMALTSRVRLRVFEEFSGALFLLTTALLVLVLIIGFTGNGAQRWISLGPLTLQPSELGKLALILMLARYYSVYEERALNTRTVGESFFYGTIVPLAFLGTVVLLVMLQKHLSCIIILGLIGLSMMVASGIRLRYLSVFTALGVAGVSCLALFTDYTKERITVWQNPEAYRLTGGWQTLQGLMAIGSGGVFGVGFGKSVLKYCYISEPANDMIFTVLCEELGFVGAILTLLLFALLCMRGFTVALQARTTFARLCAFGITSKMAIQVLLNVAVVTNTIPNTGISLPFFSYGGSSLLMLFFEMGILLSISRSSVYS